MVANVDPDLITVAEAARLLRVSAVTVQRWLRQGRLPAYHVGPSAVRIRRADLAQVITPLTRAAPPAAPPDVGTDEGPIPPVDDETLARRRAALAAAAELRAAILARRGGVPFDETWPMIRAAREERSRQLS
jgi:excisionase family DNA binding protein